MRILLKPGSFLAVLVAWKGLVLLYALLHPELANAGPGARLGELALVCGLALYALRGKRMALWVMAAYLFSQVLAVFLGIFLVSMEQPVLKLTFVALGGYFVVGGFVFARLARRTGGGKTPGP